MAKRIAKREVGLGLNISEFAKSAKTAEELLDKITQGRTISLDAKLNLGDAQAVLQKILDQKTVSIRTALDVKDLMSIMEKSIADFEQRGSSSLAKMNRRFLEEFQTGLGSVNFKLDDGTLIGGYQKAIEQANNLNLLSEKQGKIADEVANKTRKQTVATKQQAKATEQLEKAQKKSLDTISRINKSNLYRRGETYYGKSGRLNVADLLGSEAFNFNLTKEELVSLAEFTYEHFSKVRNVLVDLESWTKAFLGGFNESRFVEKFNELFPTNVFNKLRPLEEFQVVGRQVKDGLLEIPEALSQISIMAKPIMDAVQQQEEKNSQDSVKQIEDAYEAAKNKVHELRDSLSQANQELEKMQKNAEFYGYTTEMSARQAGYVQQVLAKNNRAQYVVGMLQKGYTTMRTSSGEYGFDRSDLGRGVYNKITKTEYNYAQYLASAIEKLNVGWEEGLKILASQNGQLDAAIKKVAQLEAELSNAEKMSEKAYERMAYAHSGIFGDDEIAAKKKELAGAERAAESNKKLESSYKGLAEAVEQYVESSKKLWAAYDNGEDFSKFAEERNAAIEKIASLFPADDISGIPASLSQSGYKILLQSKEMSSQFAKDGAEATLKAIETSLGQAAEEVRLAEEAKRIEEERLAEEAKAKQIADEAAETKRKQAEAASKAAEAEERYVAAAENAADAEERKAEAAGETRKQLEGQKNAEDAIGDMTDDVAKSLIDKDLKRQLSVLKDALKNTFSDTHNLLDLSDLVSADQLESKLSQMAQDALKGTQGPLEFAKVNITDGVATLTLFNKELGVTVKETWQLKDSFDNVSESVEMNRVAAEKYAKQQENAVAQTGKKINQFTSRLDTQIRSYTSGTYPISGATPLFNLDATTLEKNADNIEYTIDGLVNHIKNLIQKANTDGLTGSLEVEIDKNLRALDNVIKTEQNLQRISIELKAASIPEVIKQLGIALDELETKAKKSGVYTNELAKNITNLRDSLPKLGEDDVLLPDIDYKGQISKIADQIKTEQKKLTASINTKNLEEQQSKDVDKAVASYEKLLEARIKLNQLESEGADKTSSEYQKANRRVEELNAQNEAAKNVLQTEEQLNSYRQRTSRLDSEYNAAIQEQQRKQFDEQQAASIKAQEEQIKQYYQTILDTVNKINSLDVEITGLKGKNGTGLYTNLINKLQSEKQALITNVRQILQEVGDEFGNGFVGSQDVALSGARFFTEADTKNLNDFMQSAQVQSALASGDINKFTECVNQLSAAFTNSEKVGIEAATKIQESFAKAQEAASKIFNIDPTAGVIGSNGDINEANKLYQQAKNAYEMLNLARAKIGNKPETDWTAQESLGIEILTQQFLEYANTLDTVVQKEQKYFAGKSKYTDGETIDSNELIQRTSENASKLTSQYDKLSEAAKKYAGQNELIITKFSQSADGINKLDFSTFNKVTGELRNFTFEMGSATDSIYKSGDVIKNTMSAFDTATKQMQSAGGLLNQVKQAGLEGSVEVETLKKKVSELTAELAKGGNADDTELSRLAKDAKISQAEVEKLYKKHLQLQDAIDSRDAKRLGDIDLNGNVYKQLAHHINAFAQSMQGTDVKIGNFNKKTGQLKFTMNAADDTVKEFTVSLDRLGKTAVAQETGVKDLGSKWDQFKASLSSTGKQLMAALVGYNVFFKAISEIRKGIGYVKEIDLAMTELKKVTDETEASYSNFLKTASKTASTIGSTISDFTDATANFARLGYSMEESAKMAETAIVYKNVAD